MSVEIKSNVDGTWLRLGPHQMARLEPGWVLEHHAGAAQFAPASDYRRFESLEGAQELLLRHLPTGSRFTFDTRRCVVMEIRQLLGSYVIEEVCR